MSTTDKSKWTRKQMVLAGVGATTALAVGYMMLRRYKATNVEKTMDHPDGKQFKQFLKQEFTERATHFREDSHRDHAEQLALSSGYTKEELAEVGGANLGLGCGNPTKLANLQPGEVVLDLGCGEGIDVQLAAKRVSPGGKAIGLDMVDDMLARARENAAANGIENVEFLSGEIENIPVSSESVNVIVSNCVLTLVPDKLKAFKDMFRVLAPGGRISVSDCVLRHSWPSRFDDNDKVHEFVQFNMMDFLKGIDEETYIDYLQQAGFTEIRVTDKNMDLNTWKSEMVPEEGREVSACESTCDARKAAMQEKKIAPNCETGDCLIEENTFSQWPKRVEIWKKMNGCEQSSAARIIGEIDMNYYISSCYIHASKPDAPRMF